MILPDLKLQSTQNKQLSEFGMDNRKYCYSSDHVSLVDFDSYPYDINYKFNSRGFRDDEWPQEDLQECIWCFGDSYTVGIGNPIEHTWTNILQQMTKKRCINISLGGTSNDWLSRKVIEVLQIIKPKNVVMHWSYLQRGESDDVADSDESRRIPIKYILNKDQFENFKTNLLKVNQENINSNIIHSVIPDAYINLDRIWNDFKGIDWPEQLPAEISDAIVSELKNFKQYDFFEDVPSYISFAAWLKNLNNFIPQFDKLDLARDSQHYGKLTADKFVELIIKELNI